MSGPESVSAPGAASLEPHASPRLRVLVVNDDEDSLYLLGRSVRQALPEAELVLMESSIPALSYFQEHAVTAVTLALQYLLKGAELGEVGLYIPLSETRGEIMSVARSHAHNRDNEASLHWARL